MSATKRKRRDVGCKNGEEKGTRPRWSIGSGVASHRHSSGASTVVHPPEKNRKRTLEKERRVDNDTTDCHPQTGLPRISATKPIDKTIVVRAEALANARHVILMNFSLFSQRMHRVLARLGANEGRFAREHVSTISAAASSTPVAGLRPSVFRSHARASVLVSSTARQRSWASPISSARTLIGAPSRSVSDYGGTYNFAEHDFPVCPPGEELGFCWITPKSLIKGLEGGILSRLLSTPGMQLVGARMYAPNDEFVDKYIEIHKARSRWRTFLFPSLVFGVRTDKFSQ